MTPAGQGDAPRCSAGTVPGGRQKEPYGICVPKARCAGALLPGEGPGTCLSRGIPCPALPARAAFASPLKLSVPSSVSLLPFPVFHSHLAEEESEGVAGVLFG